MDSALKIINERLVNLDYYEYKTGNSLKDSLVYNAFEGLDYLWSIYRRDEKDEEMRKALIDITTYITYLEQLT